MPSREEYPDDLARFYIFCGLGYGEYGFLVGQEAFEVINIEEAQRDAEIIDKGTYLGLSNALSWIAIALLIAYQVWNPFVTICSLFTVASILGGWILYIKILTDPNFRSRWIQNAREFRIKTKKRIRLVRCLSFWWAVGIGFAIVFIYRILTIIIIPIRATYSTMYWWAARKLYPPQMTTKRSEVLDMLCSSGQQPEL